MPTITDRFERATRDVTRLPERPDDDTLLQIYALYKQATIGDVEGDRPGFMDFVAVAKYDAWDSVSGVSQNPRRRHTYAREPFANLFYPFDRHDNPGPLLPAGRD